jgi:hypothetical protein
MMASSGALLAQGRVVEDKLICLKNLQLAPFSVDSVKLLNPSLWQASWNSRSGLNPQIRH